MVENKSIGFTNAIVLGTGAIGSYYGAHLSKKIDVLLVGWRGHVNAINTRGLAVSGVLEGRFYIRASTELRSIPQGSLILLTTKVQESETAIKGVRGLLSFHTAILVLQNGLGNEDLVGALVGPKIEVIRGLASSGVEFLAPGEIEVKLVGGTVLPRTVTGERIKPLFDSCGLETRLSGCMDVDIWRKLTLNCVINPLTAIFRVTNNEIVAESLREVRRRIVDECIKVARKEGIVLDPSLVETVTGEIARYSNLSSMCQDVIKGQKTEIDFLNGRVSELGRKHGVDTPVNDVMASLIRFMEGGRWTLSS